MRFSAVALVNLFLTGFNNATEKYIVKRSSIDSIDAKIDNSLYLVKQLELKIEKLKTFFSSDKPDESNYRRTENHIVRTSVYDTISSVFRIIFIMIFYFIGIFLLLTGVIFKLMTRNASLKKRIENLEHAVFRKDILTSGYAD